MPKVIVPLTLKEIKEAKPKDKQYRLFDGGGLLLCVYPTGKKVWRLDYKDINGKRKSYTIGDLNEVSLTEARKIREELKDKLDHGKTIQLSAQNTFESVFRDWWVRWSQTVSKRHADRALVCMENDVFPVIGAMPINKIEPQHIVLSLQEIEKRNALEQLHKTKSTIKMAFDFAVARGLCKYNPAAMVSAKAFKPHEAKNYRSLDKQNIYQLFEMFENERFNLSVRLCTEFILRNMTRASESAKAEWKEYDEERQLLIIPAERMKMGREHIIPLSTQSIEILNKIRELSGGTQYIFPSQNFASHLSQDYPLMALKRQKIDTTIHGLRHLSSTIMNETGLFRPDVIEACLAHKDSNTVRSTYNKAQYIEERREALQWWSDFIDQCKDRGSNLETLKKYKVQ
ncbi:integrase [Wohlfahrtiimonas chitiniclastica]|uniref:tyrosine-type recombinase/integrase n=1 Tax=Wohlfahrtiimonas chitiniclastica TaxID=400946 RepID=UPI000B97FD6C|nr:integrase arm-type DNA-binding domain-containing protein [Wohlfahrtiimonas chitiniclastica]OYQ87209.1 integrase [Wohlfahrtiimonas chitiniclastica]